MRVKMWFMAGTLLIVALLLIPSVALADATATRALPDTVEPGEQFTVNITTQDLLNGSVLETIPAGFVYAGSPSISASCDMTAVFQSGTNAVQFIYLDAIGGCVPGTFSFDVVASSTPGSYTFAGEVVDASVNPPNVAAVDGDSVVVVLAPPPEDVVINEFVSDPTTGNECIELYNKSGGQVDLTGWTIEDGTGNPNALDGNTMAAGEYLALEGGTDFTFALNNNGDIVVLKKGVIEADKVTYGNWDDGDDTDNATAPGDDLSTGRIPNGADSGVDNIDFRELTVTTCGSMNLIESGTATAMRTLPASVLPLEQFEVSVYCMGISVGGLTEIMPNGFDYVNGSQSGNIMNVNKDGNTINFTWMAEPGTVTYEVVASGTEGTYQFDGMVKGFPVGGGSQSAEVIATVTGDQNVDVSMVKFNLTMAKSGNGAVVPAEGVNIYNEGTVVDITATPDAGWRFDSWTGDTGTIADAGAADTTITMNADYSITANFVQQYTLTIAKSGSGTGTVDPAEGVHTYDVGAVVNLTATPVGEDSNFNEWTGDTGTIADADAATTTITMNGDYSIAADFTLGFSACSYDDDSDGSVSKQEALAAVVEFFDGIITKQEALEVIVLFFDQGTPCS